MVQKLNFCISISATSPSHETLGAICHTRTIKVQKKGEIYFDSLSLSLLIVIIIIIGLIIGLFFIFLSIPTSIIGIIFIFFLLKRINNVIYIDDYLNILSPFLIPKKIEFSQLMEIKCEMVGFGRSRDILIYVYYKNDNKTKKSILTNYRIFGKKKVIKFLDNIELKKIDIESFKMLNIEFRENKFILT